jgi:glycosyltransferase involved in cell wall biosynthesis
MAFPLRLIEAMSYGKPVVVSDLGEMPRIIGQCGLVFPHEDAGSLAEALERLLSDRSLYKECAENCYQKAKEYHPSRTIRRLVDLYREIALGG